ncbi:GWxTD domain-containing protein [Rhodothermus profundi]|uniref:GWxTD domain-containing protein n=1 Tax=Rhodothermus profundi TaxID=633813 RepID=UPI001FE44ACF|nr:GWxTD domain-containing protein [Rhodothermus profundi]
MRTHLAPTRIGCILLVGWGSVLVGSGGCRSVPAALEASDAFEAPAFVLEAIPVLRNGRSGVELYLGLRPRSLVFVEVDTAYRATYEVLVRLLDEMGQVRYEQAFHDTLWVPSFAATRTHAFQVWHRFVAYQPGRYRLEVTVMDRSSRRYATHRRQIHLLDPTAQGPVLSSVWLMQRAADGRYAVYPGLHVAAAGDSLRAAVKLFRLRPQHQVQVQMRLMYFLTDTSAARLPYDLMPMPGTLPYQGIRYDRPETLRVSTRRVEGLRGQIQVDFPLPPLVKRGVYRVEVVAQVEGQHRSILSRRELAVHSPAFPQVTTLDQMVEALVYLTYPEEWAFLRAARTPVELRHRFDAFWGRLIGDRRRAARLLRLYYERIEQANWQFTTFKEGWQTDRGMVYVILGPPFFIEERFDAHLWYYTYNEQDSRYVFVFERVYQSGAAFGHYVLRRHPFYYEVWQQALRRWRTGQVL